MAVSNATKAYGILKKRILTGVLLPGEMLTETQLVEDLNMSRTPIRQALQMLAKDNLIKMRPHRGVFINQMSPKDIQELFEARYAIEKYAFERFMKKGVQQQDICFLKQFLVEQEKKKEHPVNFMTSDRQFHLYIIQRIDNKFIENMLGHIRDQILLVGVKSLTSNSIYDQVIQEHHQIIKAIEQRDEPMVIEKVKQHIENSRKRILLF